MSSTNPALVFPPWFLAEFMHTCQCSACGRQARSREVFAPSMRQLGQHVELIYPTRCPCGGTCETIRIKMPLLLFGFALAWFELPRISRRRAHACGTAQVTARETTHASLLHREFERHLAVLMANRVMPLSEVDRQQLEMDEKEWSEFMKRIDNDLGRGGAA